MQKKNNNSGFTLIELLVVVLIIGILAAIALPQYRRSVERTRVAEALTVMRSLYDSCERQAWEKGQDSCYAALVEQNKPENTTEYINVKKMDILVKGTYQGNLGIQTENFLYQLQNSSTDTVIAVPKKGDYTDKATISLSGETGLFSCSSDAGVCAVWGSNTWNK